RFELVLVDEEFAIRARSDERFDDLARDAAPLDNVQELLVRDHLLEPLLEFGSRDLHLLRRNLDDPRFGRAANEIAVQFALVLDIGLGLAALDAEERRLRDVDVALLDDFRQLPVKERQQQRADVGAVHVRVGHDDDAVVAQLADVEIFRADAAAERRDHRLDFVAREHLVEPRLLDVQNLALERQDGLEPPIAALLGRAAGRLALHDVQLAQRRIALLAVGELAGQRAAVERALAPDQIAGL